MFSFFNSFSTSLKIALLAWPFVALALTFPLLVVQYMRLRRLVFGRIIMVYLVMLYALALLAFTLYPMPDNPVQFCSYHNIIPQIEWLESIMEFRYEGLRAVLQVVMNVVFFMPLGIFIRMMYKSRWYLVIFLGLAISLTIETAQLTGGFGIYPCSYRLFDVDDLLLNTCGGLIGYWLGFLMPNLSNVERGSAITTQPGLVRRLVAFMIDIFSSLAIITIIGISLYFLAPQLAKDLSYESLIILTILNILIQLILPLICKGRTIGGMLTGISLDDIKRTQLHRLTFYLARLIYIGLFFYADKLFAQNEVAILVGLVLIILTIITWKKYKNLPYKLIDIFWKNHEKSII
ncbi:MAG: VanZ family protein [Candidatus Nanosynbacter sp. HMT-348_TM7c-JB]|nr:MAG: VanZ family protein [Candidatus Nanosynbacter sp. HMT-348_TM7c-JB]